MRPWLLVGTKHLWVTAVVRKRGRSRNEIPDAPEFLAQDDRVFVIGIAAGKIKATNKPFKDDWVFVITVSADKVASIREYIDTQALARAAQTDATTRK